jgi:hypothetical protein
MLEVSAVPQGVAHILMIQALGIEDVIQCSLASVGCTSGTRDGWSGGVDLFTGPLLPTLVGLLVRVASRCWWHRFCSPDEVLSPFVSGDVEVASRNSCSEVVGAFCSMARTKAESLDPR